MSFRIENHTLVSLNPATGEEVGCVPLATEETVRNAVTQAWQAYREWGLLSFEERARYVTRGIKRLQAVADTIGSLICDEMGKPLPQALGEARYAPAHILEEVIPQARQAQTPQILAEGDLVSTLHYVPRGVVAVITPWNFPVNLSLNALIPALLTGNTVVYKPSENTPLTGDALAQALIEALPEGVLQVVHGDGRIGKALVEAEISMVAFVGSQETGRRIMAAQAEKLNPVILEMGGKDPMLVLDDADIERAASFAVQGSLRNSGQVCVSVERIYVDQAIAERFEARTRELMQNFTVGHPRQEGIQMGPLVSAAQRQKVLDQLADARQKGAHVEGGEIPAGPGSFLTPALVTGASDDMALMQDETFGPVIAIQRVSSPADALAKANALPYGLGATVWGRDEERAARIASRVESGMIGINRGLGGASGTPFVGNKQSTVGFFGSVDGIRQFTQVRVISQTKGS